MVKQIQVKNCVFLEKIRTQQNLFAGKTVWLEKLIRFRDEMFRPPPKRIIVFYKKYQERYNRWEQEIPDVKCIQGLRKDLLESDHAIMENNAPVDLPLLEATSGARDGTLVIIDDFMTDLVNDPFFTSLYTAGRHYGIVGIVSIWHQIFPPGRHQRTISLNQHCYILMRSPRLHILCVTNVKQSC